MRAVLCARNGSRIYTEIPDIPVLPEVAIWANHLFVLRRPLEPMPPMGPRQYLYDEVTGWAVDAKEFINRPGV